MEDFIDASEPVKTANSFGEYGGCWPSGTSQGFEGETKDSSSNRSAVAGTALSFFMLIWLLCYLVRFPKPHREAGRPVGPVSGGHSEKFDSPWAAIFKMDCPTLQEINECGRPRCRAAEHRCALPACARDSGFQGVIVASKFPLTLVPWRPAISRWMRPGSLLPCRSPNSKRRK